MPDNETTIEPTVDAVDETLEATPDVAEDFDPLARRGDSYSDAEESDGEDPDGTDDAEDEDDSPEDEPASEDEDEFADLFDESAPVTTVDLDLAAIPESVRPQVAAIQTELGTYRQASEALANPDFAGVALKTIAQNVADAHGTTVAALLGLAEPGEYEEEYDENTEWGRTQKQLKELTAWKENLEARERETQAKAEQRKQILAEAPNTIAALGKRIPGFVVTPEEVLLAAETFPNMKLETAVQVRFMSRKDKALMRAAAVQRAPAAVPATGNRGKPADNRSPLQRTGADY